MGNEVVTYQELEKKAVAVAKSGLFGVKSPEQAISLFLVAEAEGIPIMQAVLDYYIIDNKPSLKSDAMLRRFQASGGIIKWVERTDKKVSAYFSHPSCPDPILIDWDFERAAKAGLSTRQYKSGEPNMWVKFPRQMLTARVISEGIRATAPGAASGVYTPEEVADFEPTKAAPVVEKRQEAREEPRKAEDAEVVTPTSGPGSGAIVQAEEPKPLSGKTLGKFSMVKGFIGDEEFSAILKKHNFNALADIKDEENATLVLRDMRVACEKKSKPVEVGK